METNGLCDYLKFQYNNVRYTFVQSKACEARLLTSDAWSYLSHYLISQNNNSDENIERAKHYSELAESFFIASKAVKLPVKATLLYYSMLNLVKCYLSLNGTPFEQKNEHHGPALSR